MRVEPFCPVDVMIDLIGSRSTLVILRELFGGPKRTNDLLKALDLSSATLLERLRSLESTGIVERITYAEAPPRVEYQLTDKGYELEPILLAMRQVAARWQMKNCVTAVADHAATCEPCQLQDVVAVRAAKQAQNAAAKRNEVHLL